MQTVVHQAKGVSSRPGAIAIAGLLGSLFFYVFSMPGFSETNPGDGAQALLQVVPGAHRATGKLTEPGVVKGPGQSRRAQRNAKLPVEAASEARLAAEVTPAPNRRKMNRGGTRATLAVVAPANPSVNQISRKRSR